MCEVSEGFSRRKRPEFRKLVGTEISLQPGHRPLRVLSASGSKPPWAR